MTSLANIWKFMSIYLHLVKPSTLICSYSFETICLYVYLSICLPVQLYLFQSILVSPWFSKKNIDANYSSSHIFKYYLYFSFFRSSPNFYLKSQLPKSFNRFNFLTGFMPSGKATRFGEGRSLNSVPTGVGLKTPFHEKRLGTKLRHHQRCAPQGRVTHIPSQTHSFFHSCTRTHLPFCSQNIRGSFNK